MGDSKNGGAAPGQSEPSPLPDSLSNKLWGGEAGRYLSLSLEVGMGFEGAVMALPFHNHH